MSSPGQSQRLSSSAEHTDSSEKNGREVSSRNNSSSDCKKSPKSSATAFRKRSSCNSCNINQGRTSPKKNKGAAIRENQANQKTLSKICSEPWMPSRKAVSQSVESKAEARNVQGVSHLDMAGMKSMKRSMTESDMRRELPNLAASNRSPLAQLFNVFQRNVPEPGARMLVNVTLLGSIQPMRLIIGFDATVKDVMKAAVSAYAKDGRLPPKGCDPDAYELHYSQFCLESLRPEDAVRLLGARSFVLCLKKQLPDSEASSVVSKVPKMAKPWWNVLGLIPLD